MPQTSSMSFGPTPVPTQADAETGLEEVTNGYVPWSMSSSVPCAPSKTTMPCRSSTSHVSFARVGDVLRDPVAVGQIVLGHRLQVELRRLRVRAQLQALRLQRGGDLLLEDLLVEQVLHADAEARGLVGVARADAAARGADLQPAELRLAGVVEQHVVRHDQVRVGADAQAGEVDPLGAQLVQLAGQHLRVDHDAVADRAQLAGIQDPGRDQVELPRHAVAHDGVSRVVAALEADHQIRLLREEIDDLALALVAPLGAHDHDAGHSRGISLGVARKRANRVPASRDRRTRLGRSQGPRRSAAATGSPVRRSCPNIGSGSPHIS